MKLATNTKHAVGTGEGILNLRISSIRTLVFVIVGLEIGSLDGHFLRQFVIETETDAVAVDNELHIVDILIGIAITSHLSTSRESKVLCSVPFSTQQELVGVVLEQILRIVVPGSILVEEVVPAGIDANNINRTVLNTDSQQGRHVLVDFLTVAVLVDSRNLAGFVER